MKVDIRNLLRHGTAVLLLFLSWKHLSQWYRFDHASEYLLFGILFLCAVALAAGPRILRLARGTLRTRAAVILLFLALSLPWGEWLRLNFPSSREDWSRQIFLQACFVYALLLCLQSSPGLSNWIHRKVLQMLEGGSRRVLFWLPPVMFFFFTAWISLFVFHKIPLVQDSAAHLFQARIFSEWKLFARAPAVPDFFSYQGDMLVLKDGRWFSMYLPGLAALLAFAMTLHAEWLLCPLLGAITVWIWMDYAKRWHSRQIALLCGYLCLLSPFLFLMSSTIMVHTVELLVGSAVIYLCRRDLENASTGRSFLLFFLMFLGIVTRGFSLLPFLAPVLFYTCRNKSKAGSWLSPLALAAGTLLGLAVLAFYQWGTTGNLRIPAYQLEYPGYHYGFGSSLLGQEHTPLRGLENTSNNILGLSSWLTGWYSGSLFFLFLFFLFERKLEIWDRLLILCSACLMAFYYFFIAQDLVFGPRFFYPVAPICLLFVSRSAFVGQESETTISQPIVMSLIAISLVSFLPKKLPDFVRLFAAQKTEAGALQAEITRLGPKDTLVFLDKRVGQEYVSWNDPFLRKPVVLCRDLGSENSKAIAAFPGYRPAYFRLNVEFAQSWLSGSRRIYYEPDSRSPGYVSLFELGLALQSAAGDTERDSFDICYSGLLTARGAAEQLVYLDTIARQETGETEYKKRFRSGLVHAGRMLLLPKAAFEQTGKAWKNTLNLELFRSEFLAAQNSFRSAGDVGQSILTELMRTQIRIDQDDDGALSDQEIQEYLSQKIKILETQ